MSSSKIRVVLLICVVIASGCHRAEHVDECITDAECDDENGCTSDLCTVGKCHHLPFPDAQPCSDADPCTVDDVCMSGICQGQPKDCSAFDGICVLGACDPQSGECGLTPKPDGIDCDDGLYCAVDDSCRDGTCAGYDRDCDDGDECTRDACSEGEDRCDNILEPRPGAEGPPGDSTCTNGLDDDCDRLKDDLDPNCADCLSDGECNDDNPCTADTCTDSICHNDPVSDGTGCDDGLYCTEADACAGGVCRSVARDCSSFGDECNDGVCVESTDVCEAQSKINGSTCDDGEYCTVGDRCTSGSCVPGGSRICNDDDPCTDDSCNEALDQCDNVLVPKPGQEGPYGAATCANQVDDDCDLLTDGDDPNCLQCTVPADCDDGDTCTVDDCISGDCSNDALAADGTDCDDGFYCTEGDQCEAGMCFGSSRNCSDGVMCTEDFCNEDLDACENVPNDDLCDDQNPATTDSCDPVQDCQHDTCDLDPDSVVSASSTCLAWGSAARATVFVDLRDTGGQPVSGAEVTFSTTGEPVTWVEGAVTESVSLPGTYYRTLIAPSAGAGTTVSVEASPGGSPVTLNQSVTVVYSDPHPEDGGTGGCSPADGNFRVRVIEAETGNPIANANVMVGFTEGAPFTTSVEDHLAGNAPAGSSLATTDAQGYAYFQDLGVALDGNLTVTAGQPTGASPDRAYFTFDSLRASDIVIPLRISSPAENPVRFSGGTVSDFSLTTDLQDLQEALVLPEISLDQVTAMGADNLLAKDRCVTNPDMTQSPMPENKYIPHQEVVVPGVFMSEARWALSFPQNRRLNPIFYSIQMSTLTTSCYVSELFASMAVSPDSTYFGEIGFVPSPDTSADAADYDISLGFAYPRTLTVTSSNRPAQTDLFGMVLGDYAGFDGTGPGYINGFSLTQYTSATPDEVVVPFASDGSGGNIPTAPDPGNARYYAALVARYFDPVTARPAADRPDITAENGTSTVLWRDDGSGGPPLDGAADASWTVDSFLEIAKLKTDTPHKTFIWDDVAANGTTPHLSVHELYRVTKKYRDAPLPCIPEPDVISTTRDLYWEVWRPYGTSCMDITGSEITPNPKECFTLPTLPAPWPRAGFDAATGKDDGFPPREGSGMQCVNDPDCTITGDSCVYFGDRCDDQRHRSCTADSDCDNCIPGDTCTAIWQICVANDGANDFTQQYVWHLRVSHLALITAFDFNNFVLTDRLTYLTHESTNRLVIE